MRRAAGFLRAGTSAGIGGLGSTVASAVVGVGFSATVLRTLDELSTNKRTAFYEVHGARRGEMPKAGRDDRGGELLMGAQMATGAFVHAAFDLRGSAME